MLFLNTYPFKVIQPKFYLKLRVFFFLPSPSHNFFEKIPNFIYPLTISLQIKKNNFFISCNLHNIQKILIFNPSPIFLLKYQFYPPYTNVFLNSKFYSHPLPIFCKKKILKFVFLRLAPFFSSKLSICILFPLHFFFTYLCYSSLFFSSFLSKKPSLFIPFKIFS